MSLRFQRGGDGTVTGTNDESGFTVTLSDEEEVKRLLYEDAGWPYTPPPPPVAPGHHRFTLVHDDYGCRERRFDDALYEAVKASPFSTRRWTVRGSEGLRLQPRVPRRGGGTDVGRPVRHLLPGHHRPDDLDLHERADPTPDGLRRDLYAKALEKTLDGQ